MDVINKMASKKTNDDDRDGGVAKDEGETPTLSLILERLQDALFEEYRLDMPKFDDEDSDEDAENGNVNNLWNVKQTQDGRNFREEIEKFEDAYIPIFDIDEDEEYTFEMSNIHKEFQQIIESEICNILENEFSMTPKTFYKLLLKFRDDESNNVDKITSSSLNSKKEDSSEIMQILFSVLSFEDFVRDFKRKAKINRMKNEGNVGGSKK